MLVHSAPQPTDKIQVDSPAMIGFLVSTTVPPKVMRTDHHDFFPSSRMDILESRVASRRLSEVKRPVVTVAETIRVERNDRLDFVEGIQSERVGRDEDESFENRK